MDLTTKYMGLELKNPLVHSASPLSMSPDKVKAMEDAGAAAVVMFSIFEEQIRAEMDELDHYMAQGTNSFGEALSYFPAVADYRTVGDKYVELVQKAAEAVDIPIIGSLNGVSNTGWTDFAKKIEAAGAKGLELNLYFLPTDPAIDGAAVESMYVETVKLVKAAVSIPVAVKLSPFFSATANMCKKLVDAGADALVLFNRFYQPDIDPAKKKVVSKLNLASSPNEMLVPLRWLAILSGQLDVSFAATTGVQKAEDVVKYLMAGADVTMATASILQNGIEHFTTLVSGLEQWMSDNGYDSVEALKDTMNQSAVDNPAAFERANYIKIVGRSLADM